ncbi:MAG: cytochrome c biogenesis protein CcsA [Betaproteobacteria bacterium]
MILLHVTAAALYALSAWMLWKASSSPAGGGGGRGDGPAGPGTWLLPAALLLHAWAIVHDTVAANGLDLSFLHAMSVVGALVALVAWASGLLRTLPAIGTIILPVSAAAVLLPAFLPLLFPSAFANVHRFAYGTESLAAAHVAVALVSYALFLVAAVLALVVMSLEKRLRHRLPDPTAAALPPLLTLERFLFRLVAAGFVLLTLTLASGMLFTEQLFGKPLTFTHKSVFSMLGWVTFGALLWGRWRYGWRGRIALRWIIVGTVFVFLAYLGYKFVLEVVLGR